MGGSYISRMFLVSVLILSLFFSSQGFGFGRNSMVSGNDNSNSVLKGNGNVREMMEVMDYSDPEPNTNPKTGNLLTPPSPPPSPPPEGSD
ncbi:hypothetical protein GIB67_007365 [Kingdonia uniflora]|uniref:Uncharacterized protein n=1 Tax=Kingdonia uniflora TaxID=39325 RepID=A0A7J7NY32_9MAGN|nr:hypothetical protein GIB67_007365 [Kingdonia uniflora]